MKHNHLTIEELLHYGQDGLIEGLDAEIAQRFAEEMVVDDIQELTAATERVEELRDALDEIQQITRGVL